MEAHCLTGSTLAFLIGQHSILIVNLMSVAAFTLAIVRVAPSAAHYLEEMTQTGQNRLIVNLLSIAAVKVRLVDAPNVVQIKYSLVDTKIAKEYFYNKKCSFSLSSDFFYKIT